MTTSKYKSVRTHGYASKREYKRAQELKVMEAAGLITALKEQVSFVIADKCQLLQPDGKYKTSRARRYIADFVYTENGSEVVEDAKGFRTDIYKLKRHLLKERLGFDIREV